jgi:hypothetical protein
MGNIKENTALTPDKKQVLIDEIQNEIKNVSDAIKSKQYGGAAISIIQSKQIELQNLLNKFLEKKGIITPNETTNTLSLLDNSKKARLQTDYVKSISNTTWIAVGLLVFGIGAYIYLKKK